jgi:ABC-type transporter Mla subunit MlaD
MSYLQSSLNQTLDELVKQQHDVLRNAYTYGVFESFITNVYEKYPSSTDTLNSSQNRILDEFVKYIDNRIQDVTIVEDNLKSLGESVESKLPLLNTIRSSVENIKNSRTHKSEFRTVFLQLNSVSDEARKVFLPMARALLGDASYKNIVY